MGNIWVTEFLECFDTCHPPNPLPSHNDDTPPARQYTLSQQKITKKKKKESQGLSPASKLLKFQTNEAS